MTTAPLTVNLPKNEIDFLKNYAQKHNLSISQLIDRWVKSLKEKPNIPIHPDIEKLTGIIPSDLDYRAVYYDGMMEKHK